MGTTFKFLEKNDIQPIYGPQDINAITAADGNYLSMKNYGHATIIVMIGACAATASMTIKVATSVSGGSATAWTSWDYVAVNANMSIYNAEDASDTTDYTMTAVSSYTKATGTTANQIWIVEFDSSDLPAGYDCFTVNFTDPGAADIISAVAILSEPRYTGVGGVNPPNSQTD